MIRRVGALLLVAGVALGLGSPSAVAQDFGCDDAVHDPGGVLVDPIQVAGAADDLAATHSLRVRVRVEPNIDGGLEARMARLEAACPNWAPGGVRADDLLVLIVAPEDRLTGVYYGLGASVLDSSWESIQTQTMNPLFANGQFDEGLLAGLYEIGTSIGGFYDPAEAARTPSVEFQGHRPGPPEVIDYSSGKDFDRSFDSGSDGFGSLGGLFAIGIVGMVGLGVYRTMSGTSTGSSGTTGPRDSADHTATDPFGHKRHGAFGDGSSFGGSPHGSFGGGGGHHDPSPPSGSDSGGGGSTSW